MVNTGDDKTPRSPVEKRSKALFDASVDGLSGSIRSRLTQARHAAVADLTQQGQSSLRKWMPAVGAAVVALAVTAVLFTGATLRRPSIDATLAADDMTLLLNDESLDLVEEMEFYAWLDGESWSGSDQAKP